MQPFDDEGDDSDIVFRDLIMLTLSGFVTVAVLLLPHIGESKAKSTATETTEPPGNVIIEARWPDDMDVDVDLWVQAPGDVPVGYSNKGGVVFNLLRDDLGKRADATNMNYEVSYSRGIPAGEYTINVHLYRNTARAGSIPVTVVASVKRSTQESARQILASKVDLTREGQEQTVFRFRLNDRGELVPGTVTNLQRPIRSWKPS
ncbi:hypothetical protein [Benzoatithermus flavus]|uniref:Uncharacterized protein n=1 Tax=Benzoatithermus flavus TaxID=3108223 RepID=A0ABU8XU32_9PROT